MATSADVTHREIVSMLSHAASDCGLTLRDFYDLGRAGAIDSPRLRDLWLIWGEALEPADVGTTTV